MSVEAAGFSPAWKMLVPREGTPALDFELTPAKPFTGRVVDSQGRPVAGASVEPQWQECHFFDWKATTDADGRFVWLSAPTEGEIEFRVRKAGFLAAIPAPGRGAGRRSKITINPAIRVRGSVTDAKTGQPIPAFQVIEGETVGSGRRSGAGAERLHAMVAMRSRRSSTTGRESRSSSRSRPRVTARLTSRAIIPGEKDVGHQLQARKGTGPSGLVKLPDGSPAVAADVYSEQPEVWVAASRIIARVSPFRDRTRHWVKTDSQGRFSFEPKDEPFGVFVLHAKGVAQKSASELEQSGTLTLEPFGRIEGTLRIGSEPGARQPIRVQLDRRKYASDHHFQFFEYTTMTDDQGRFTIRRRDARRSLRLTRRPSFRSRHGCTSPRHLPSMSSPDRRSMSSSAARAVRSSAMIAVPCRLGAKFDLAVARAPFSSISRTCRFPRAS